jgi:hypothetical protein
MSGWVMFCLPVYTSFVGCKAWKRYSSFSVARFSLRFMFCQASAQAILKQHSRRQRLCLFLPRCHSICVRKCSAICFWIIGLGIIAVYLACGMVDLQYGDIKAKRWNPADRLRLGIALGLCACATLITPYGAYLAKYPFQVAFSMPFGVANVVEWRPMPFNLLAGKIFLVLLLGSVLLHVVYRIQWRLEEFVLFLFAAAVSCLHIRFLLIFVPIFAMRLAVILSRWIPAYERVNDRHVLNAIFIAVMLGLMVRYFPSEANLLRNVSKNYPVAAVEYLNQYFVPGPMYNAYGFGGYLIFSRGPEHKVFIDGRSELYERGGIWPDFLEVMDVRPDALSILRKYGIQSCLIEHDEPLATFLSALPTWEKAYEDSTSILFIRRNGSQGSVALSPGAPSQGDRRL